MVTIDCYFIYLIELRGLIPCSASTLQHPVVQILDVSELRPNFP